MGIFTAVILLLIAVGLFIAVQKKYVSNETLSVLANIAGVVALLAAILVFVVPAAQPDSLSANANSVSEITPVQNIPTQAPTNQVDENNTDNWSGLLSVRVPTLNEIRAEIPASLWDENMLQVRDMYAPGVDNYTGEAGITTEYLLPIYWCANSAELLTSNMESIETQFFVNEEKIPEKHIFSYNFDTNTNWHCNYHAVVLGGWAKGSQYTLDIRRTLATDLSDGKSNYLAGDYIYRLTVKVP